MHIAGPVDVDEAFNPEGVEISMDHYVLRRLDTVSRIRALLSCKCRFPTGRTLQCYIYNAVRAGVYECIPALRNYDIESLEFDEEYSAAVYNDYGYHPEMGNPHRHEIDQHSHMARDVRLSKCQHCKHNFSVQSIKIPDCTWLLIAEFPFAIERTDLEKLNLNEIRIGGDIFYLAFGQLQIHHNNHYVYMHRFQGKWFFYDDLQGSLVRSDPKEINYSHHVNRRAFYYRKTPINPHRCLEKLHAIDLEALSKTNAIMGNNGLPLS